MPLSQGKRGRRGTREDADWLHPPRTANTRCTCGSGLGIDRVLVCVRSMLCGLKNSQHTTRETNKTSAPSDRAVAVECQLANILQPMALLSSLHVDFALYKLHPHL